ncbi:DUF190 domain-containing protein [Formosa sp. A9]|uniref:DUF190 domain-containing protein n=1 Tax=Formosa sp. A9 TaxID=3442641 RepID=UPI003EBB2996
MNTLTTIRIYFEYGKTLKNVSFWKKLHAADFASEILKRAKANNLKQALQFNVSKGYLNQANIHWGHTEVKQAKHPQIIELTDTQERIEQFLNSEKALLEDTMVVMVKNEIVMKSNL